MDRVLVIQIKYIVGTGVMYKLKGRQHQNPRELDGTIRYTGVVPFGVGE